MEICLRVSVLPIDNDADMQMIAGRIPSRTYFGDGVVFVYGLPYADQQTTAVGIESTDTTAVIDDHIIAVTGGDGSSDDGAALDGQNWGSIPVGNIQAIKAKYTRIAENAKEGIRVLKEKLADVMENRSERNRWISHFTQFSTMETLDRKAVVHMIQSIKVIGKKELEITFTYQDEYQKAIQLIQLAEQTSQRKVG